MNCNAVQPFIPALIRGEIKGRRRILAQSHIRQCASCREEYERAVKNFYALQKESVRPVPQSVTENFGQNLQALIEKEPPERSRPVIKWLVSAAALIIVGFMLGQSVRWFKGAAETVAHAESSHSLKAMLQNENWRRLFYALSSPSAKAAVAEEEVPLKLIIDKLQILRQLGMETIDLKWFSLPSSGSAFLPPRFLAVQQLKQLIVNNAIKTSDLIYLLKQAARHKKEISLKEISDILHITSGRILL